MQVLRNNNIAISDSGGYMNWFTPSGQLINKVEGESGISLFAIDQTNNILVIGREKEHKFEIYVKKGSMKIKINE